jgi:putative ABC transport system permease protein
VRAADAVRIALRDVRRQPLRSSLTVIALAISSSLFVALMTMGLATRAAIDEQLRDDTSVSSIVVSSATTLDNGPLGNPVQETSGDGRMLDDPAVAQLARLPGVRSATPLVGVWPLKSFTVDGFDRTFVARAMAVPPGSDVVTLGSGAGFAPEGNGHEVILGHGYAKLLNATDPGALVGSRLSFTTQSGYRGAGATPSRAPTEDSAADTSTLAATVVGVTGVSDQDNLVFVPMAWAHAISTVSTETAAGTTETDSLLRYGYASVVLQLSSTRDVRPTSAAVEDLGFGASSKQQQIDEINQLSTVMWIVLGAISLISMVSASLGIVNTMLMAVSEQRYAIGVWRAFGATRLLIVSLFMLQATLLGLAGGVLGSAVGHWVSGRVNSRVAGLLQAQGLGVVDIAQASPTTLAAAVAGTTLLAVLAGLYPALKAARQIQV